MRIVYLTLILVSITFLIARAQAPGRNAIKQQRYYTIHDVPLPDSILLEVGGMAFITDDRLAVCTRRGEIWIIDNPHQKKEKITYTKFAYGLHEPLGMAYHNGSIYVNQRAELTRITDTNQDGRADLFETICTWPLSGNYHEYAYGPLFTPEGDMYVTLNLSWVGRGESLTKWRGWMMKITKEGKLIPYAAGMRSPAGLGFNESGDLFFAENQGDWISSGKITHIEEGDFATHPASLRWSQEKDSPIKALKRELFPDSIGSLHEFGKNIPHFKEPSVIFPHTLMGISTSDIVTISSDQFGPFKGQLLVGDQGHSKIMRAFVEKVDGKYQGACFPFLEGFSSGVLRMTWSKTNTLFVGMTSRGWAATGQALYGLQHVSWSGSTPFEILAMRAKPDGFELEFTKPLNKKLAANLAHYEITGFTYVYHKMYGSPIVDTKVCPVIKAEVSEDGRFVRLFVDALREGYVHQLNVGNLQSQQGEGLWHDVAYYTLNKIPDGPKQDMHHAHEHTNDQGELSGCGEVNTKNITNLPSGWTKGADVEITIGTKPGLKFDKEYFEVKAGSKVKLIFNNTDDMLHNLLITKKDKGQTVGEMALHLGLKGSQLGYVPTTDDVLFNTCLLQPETAQSIYFIAPEPGDYPYICSYPGHYQIMKGVMRVLPSKLNAAK